MKNLIIIGAGGCGRETLQWAEDINKINKKWTIKGFIDDNLESLSNVVCECKVISRIDEYLIDKDDEFVCAIANSEVKEEIVSKLKSKGAVFTTIIHPTAVIADTSKIGENVIIYPFALVSDNAIISDGCIVNMYSSVAHDASLGTCCTISAHCDITGGCKLGKNVFMGTTSNMVPRISIGDNAFICAGSTVMASVRSGRKLMGNPATIIKF